MILRKKAFLLPLFGLALALFTFGCEKEAFTPSVEPGVVPVEARLGTLLGKSFDQDSTSTDEDFDSLAYCFQFNFPLTFVTEDGGTYVIDDENAVIDSTVLIADFAYPFLLTLTDGTEREITDFDAFLAVLTACYGEVADWEDEDWEDDHGDCPIDVDPEDALCFDFVFPFAVTDGQTTTTIDDEAAFFAFVERIDSTNAAAYDFVYPFTVRLLADQSTVTIADAAAFENLLESCFGFDEGEEVAGFGDCFTVDYPVSLMVTDSTGQTNSVEVVDEENLADLLAVHGQPGTTVEITFPITVVLAEGQETVTLADEEGLDDLLDDCDN